MEKSISNNNMLQMKKILFIFTIVYYVYIINKLTKMFYFYITCLIRNSQ